MEESQTELPDLTVNALFMRDLMAASPPCFALGYVHDGHSKTGFIALRPETPIPNDTTAQGFSFGHSILGVDGKPVLHFAFQFYDYDIFHGLALPSNPMIQAVIDTMLQTEDYFFFSINPNQTVTAFRSQLETSNLVGLRTNRERFCDESCSPEQYDRAVKAFTKKPDPPGQVMEWVCRHDWNYLDIDKYPLTLTPKKQ